MPTYKYAAKNEAGRTVHGMRRAADEDELYRRLKEEDLFLTAVKTSDKMPGGGRRLKSPEVADFCQQFGTLLSAGITLVRALGILAAEDGLKPHIRAIYESLLGDIRRGNPLSFAMESLGDVFPALLINMLRASEGTGNIDKTALRMASHYEKEHKLNQKVKSAMVYPIVVLCLAVGVLIFVMTYIIPQFQPLFDQMPQLPWPTLFVMGVSDLLRQHWTWLLLGLAALIFLIKTLSKIPSVRLGMDKRKLRIPMIGKLLSTIYTARFARTLSSLYASGMPIITALQVGRTTVGNAYIEAQFDQVVERVRGGDPLSTALDGVDGLKKKLCSSIFVGEETGNLDTMLNTIADGMEYESELSIQKMVTLLEPLLLIIMALIVGFVIIAVMMPIFDSYAVYGGNDVGGI